MKFCQNPCLSRQQQLLLLLLLVVQFPVAVQSTFSLWTFFVIFPQIRCFLRLWLMNYDPTAYERYDVFYREDSVERLAETGDFLGKNAILEYMLGGSDAGPFYASAPEVESLQFQLQDYQNNVCTFLAQSVIVQTTNPANTASPQVTIRSATMTKMKMDLAGGYWKSQDFYFGRGFWDVGLRNMQDSDNTRAYICSVMSNQCAAHLPEGESTNCLERLQALPFLTMSPVDETVFSFQQNSQACRALHAAFAFTNPEKHCAHISFQPLADPDGKVKCQENSGPLYRHSDLFTDGEIASFETFMVQQGFDPESGIEYIV